MDGWVDEGREGGRKGGREFKAPGYHESELEARREKRKVSGSE